MLLNYLAYALLGKLLIFLFQKSRFSNIGKGFLKELFECDLCIGVWIYFGLAILFGDHVNIFTYILDYYNLDYYQIFIGFIVTAFFTGAVTSFLVWVFSAGWNEKFSVLEIR